MKCYSLLVWAIITLVSASNSLADTVIFKSGEIVECVVLQTNGSALLVRRDQGTFTYPTDKIKEVRKSGSKTTRPALSTSQIAGWGTILEKLTKHPWAHGAKQIPATVIDEG